MPTTTKAEREAGLRPFTQQERLRAFWLNRVRLPAGPRATVARLARDSALGEISEDEAHELARLAWRFGKRIPRDLVPLVEPQRHRRFGGDD